MTISDVNHALSQPAHHVASTLVDLPETQWFDRKSARIQAKKLAETLVAMGNAEGGVVAVGLSDGVIEHVTDDQANALRQAAIDFTQPPVRVRAEECLTPPPEEDEQDHPHDPTPRRTLLLHVTPGETLHEMSDGMCFLRIGDETRRLTHAQRQELFYDRSDSSYDSTPNPSITIDDLDAEAIGEFRTAVGAQAPVEHLLTSRGLVAGSGAPTVAATLVADAPGIRWYRARFTLSTPDGLDVGWRLALRSPRFEDGRADPCQIVLYVNGWNTGVYIGDIGPQSEFTIPAGFLDPNGENTLALWVAAKEAGAGPESIELVTAFSRTGAAVER